MEALCPLIVYSALCTLAPGCSWPVSVHGLVSTGPGARAGDISASLSPILPPSDNLIVTNITPVPSQIDLSDKITK